MKKEYVKYIVAVIVLMLCVVVIALAHKKTTNGKKSTANEGQTAVAVELAKAKRMQFENRVSVQGTLEAKNYANVSARIPGTIEKIFVDEGDKVEKNKTRLFQIDNLKLQRALEIKRQDVAVARYSLKERQAMLEQVEAEFRKVKIDIVRYKNLYEQGAVSSDHYEQQQSIYDQIAASRKHALSLVDLAAEQVRQAETALVISKKDLSDSLVYAPISGIVSHTYSEEGEMATAGQPILRVEDLSVIEASAFLPADYYDKVYTEKTQIAILLPGGSDLNYPVSYKSPTINTKLRTFEIKGLIKNPPEGAVPGAMTTMDVIVEQHEALGVPTDAVLERSGKKIVFTAKDGKAHMREVSTGMKTGGYIELKGDGVSEGTSVVVRGQTFLNDDAPLAVAKENR